MQLKPFTFSPNGSANTEMENILLIAPNTSASIPNRFTFLPEVITSASSMTALSV